MLELRYIASFLEIADQGSISRASRSLGLAQPALSRQLKALEETLGVALFHRNGRGVELSAAGEIFHAHARSALLHLTRAQEEIAFLNGEPRGIIKLGLPQIICATFLSPLVTLLRDRHPLITLRIEEAISSNLAEWLQAGKIDVALVYQQKSSEGFDNEPLLTEQLMVAHSPQAQIESPVSPEVLATLPLAVPTRPSALRDIIDARLSVHGLVPNVKFEIDPVPTLKMHAIEGTACTILPMGALKAELAAGVIAATPIAAPAPGWTIELILPKGRRLDLATKAVIQAVKEVAAHLQNEPSLGFVRAQTKERYPLSDSSMLQPS
jgi:LysR family nitrogen assimilation transcriptional regulator